LSKIDKIEKHLKDGKPITQREAIDLYDSYRLSGVIFSLKKRGMSIESNIIKADNDIHFAEYRMVA